MQVLLSSKKKTSLLPEDLLCLELQPEREFLEADILEAEILELCFETEEELVSLTTLTSLTSLVGFDIAILLFVYPPSSRLLRVSSE